MLENSTPNNGIQLCVKNARINIKNIHGNDKCVLQLNAKRHSTSLFCTLMSDFSFLFVITFSINPD